MNRGGMAHIASEVKKAANNAARRYRRSLEWLQSEDQEDRKIKGERSTVQVQQLRTHQSGRVK
eukprot:667006-Amphidinium_carterae.1